MNRRLIAIFLTVMMPAMVWGADSKEQLRQARSNYQQTVATHGQNSPEARNARHHLRDARRNFHTERRQQQNRRPR